MAKVEFINSPMDWSMILESNLSLVLFDKVNLSGAHIQESSLEDIKGSEIDIDPNPPFNVGDTTLVQNGESQNFSSVEEFLGAIGI